VRHHAGIAEVYKPYTHQVAFVFGACQNAHGRWRPVEDRNRADALFGVAVNIRECGTQQTIGLHSDLVRGAVIDVQGPGAPPNIDTQCSP